MEQPENPNGTMSESTTPLTPEQQPESETKEPKKKSKLVLIILALLLLLIIGLAVVYYFAFYNKDGVGDTTDKKDATEQQQEQAAKVDLSQYDGQTLKIISTKDNIKGTVWLTYDQENNKIKAEYQALLNDDLPVNGTCGGSVDGRDKCLEMIRHEYAQETTSQKDSSKKFDVFLYPVLCNKGQLLDTDRQGEKFDFYGASACEVDNKIQEKTETFLVWGRLEFDSYEEILGLYDVVVYDSSQYWVETTDENAAELADDPEGTRRFELESEKSIEEKNKVRGYVMEFGE